MISFITPSTRCKNPKITEITLVFAVTTTTARLHCLFPQRRYNTSVSPQLGHLTGTDDRWLIRELVFSLFLPNWVHCQLLRALTPHFKSCTIPDCHLVGVGTLKNTKLCHLESWKSRAFHPNKTQTDWVTERWEISLASATWWLPLPCQWWKYRPNTINATDKRHSARETIDTWNYIQNVMIHWVWQGTGAKSTDSQALGGLNEWYSQCC